MPRQYSIWETSDAKTERLLEFIVTDLTAKESELDDDRGVSCKDSKSVRPPVAIFPISQLYDQETQFHRAKMLRDYLNKLNKVTEQAISETALIDILAAQPKTV